MPIPTTPQTSLTGVFDGTPCLWYVSDQNGFVYVAFRTGQPVKSYDDRSWFRLNPDQEHYLARR